MTNERIMLEEERIEGVALHMPGGGIFKAERPARHDVVVLKALQHYSAEEVSRGIQGFCTNLEHFVDRKEAAKIAYEAGQIAEPVSILMSEDLW